METSTVLYGFCFLIVPSILIYFQLLYIEWVKSRVYKYTFKMKIDYKENYFLLIPSISHIFVLTFPLVWIFFPTSELLNTPIKGKDKNHFLEIVREDQKNLIPIMAVLGIQVCLFLIWK